jgi:membrane associated rhomboid family serine protease
MRQGFGTLQPRLTPAVKGILIAMVTAFLAQLVLRTFGGISPEILFGFSPPTFLSGRIWQIFSYAFLHAGPWHIMMNALILYMLGTELESRWGSRRFLKYFAVSGVGGALLQTLIWLLSLVAFPSQTGLLSHPIVGASGALYGLFMAFALLYGNTQVLVFFLVPMKVKHFVALLAAIDIISAVFYSSSGVAHLVHLGGLGTGWLYLKWKGPDLNSRGGGFFKKRRMGRDEMRRRLSVVQNNDDRNDKGKYPITWN